MEEKLKNIAEAYVDLLLKTIKNPDPYFFEVNQGIRNLQLLDRMGLIRLPNRKCSEEHF